MRRIWGVGIVLLLLLSPHGVFAQGTGKGRGSRLKGNYPNPFNPTTTIAFSVFVVLEGTVMVPVKLANAPAASGATDLLPISWSDASSVRFVDQ